MSQRAFDELLETLFGMGSYVAQKRRDYKGAQVYLTTLNLTVNTYLTHSTER